MKKKILLLVIFIFILNLNKWHNNLILERLLSSLLIFMGILPFLYQTQNREKIIPFFEFVSLFYILFFSFPLFFIDLNEEYFTGLLNQRSIIKALFYANVGYIFLLIGFISTKKMAILKFIPNIKVNIHREKNIPLLLIVMFILGILAEIFSGRVALILKAVFYIFSFFPRISMCLLFLYFLQKRLNIFYTLMLFVIIIPYIFIKDFESGLLGGIIFDITSLLYIYWYVFRKIPYLAISLFVILFLPFNYTKSEYRLYTWYGPYARANTFEKIGIHINLLSEKFKTENILVFINGWEALIKRLDLLSQFSKCIDLTPEVIPFWKGYSLRTLLTAPIPRFVMPWKPVENMGQEFGHRYGFLHPTDFWTSINLPILIELYINWGLIGIIIGMFIIGFLYRCLYKLINYENLDRYVASISIVIFYVIQNISSNISLLFGNLIEYIIVLYLIFLILQRIER